MCWDLILFRFAVIFPKVGAGPFFTQIKSISAVSDARLPRFSSGTSSWVEFGASTVNLAEPWMMPLEIRFDKQ